MKNTFRFNYIALLLAFFIASCTKESNISTTIPDKTESRIVVRTMPTVQSGILKFSSKAHLKDFWDDVESADEAQLDSIEALLGYTSLRTHYNQLIAQHGNLNSLSYEVKNPFDIMVFNKNHELWVGNDVYKLIRPNMISKVDAAYVSELISLRNTDKVIKENILLYDKLTGELLPEIKVSLRTECSINLSQPLSALAINGNQTMFFIQPMLINIEGQEKKGCAGSLGIRWEKNGSFQNFGTDEIDDIRSHAYNVGPGECKSFEITVSFTPVIGCSNECNGLNEKTFTVTVCSPVTCSGLESSANETLVFEGSYDGNKSAKFFMGYDANNYFWHDSRLWGRIEHFTNGQASKPGFKLEVRLHGAIFKNTCTGQRVPIDRTKFEKSKNFKFRHDEEFDFRLRSDDDMFAAFKVFGTSGTVPDLQLLNKSFSSL